MKFWEDVKGSSKYELNCSAVKGTLEMKQKSIRRVRRNMRKMANTQRLTASSQKMDKIEDICNLFFQNFIKIAGSNVCLAWFGKFTFFNCS